MLDPELSAAVDFFFTELREKITQRLEVADREYKGQWKRYTLEELQKERADEMLDFLAYTMFIAVRFGNEAAGLGRDLEDE